MKGKITEGNIMDRKPDLETESFRMWSPTKAEEKKLKKVKDNQDIVMKYKGMEMSLVGFNIARNKKTKKINFAWKFKHKDKMMLYYIPGNKGKKDKEMLAELKRYGDVFGYRLQDALDTLKNLHSQKHILDKLGGKTNEKR